MAIWAYVGLPRHGKSYHAVMEQVIPALKQGRTVVTNIPLVAEGLAALGCDTSGIVQVTNEELQDKPAETIEAKCVPGALVLFDELWRFLPQGVSGKNVDRCWQTLFAEHGHRVDAAGRMMQIVLVVQDLGMVAAFARSLVERTVVVTKLTALGSDKKYRVDVFAGYVTGLKPPIKKRISEEFGAFDAAIYKCYVSRTMAVGSAAKVDESVMSGRGTVWRNPGVRYGLPIAVALICWGLWRSYHYFFPPPPAPRAQQSVKDQPRGGLVPAVRSQMVVVERMRARVAAVLRGASDVESRVLVDFCDGSPSRWVPWYAARCGDLSEGGIACEYRGRKVEFRAAIQECRQTDERRAAEVRWFPSDAGGSHESVSIVGKSAVDGAGR